MRASLPHPLAKRRHSHEHAAKRPAAPARTPDRAVQRVRHAGGPVDQAFYSCECGYVFVAQVSTTVRCPHCDAGQAW
jgi:hypothetical protein